VHIVQVKTTCNYALREKSVKPVPCVPMKKVIISRRALILRIRRKLRKKNQSLVSDHRGNYHLVDPKGVVEEAVDLVALGKRHKALWPWEEMAE